jgi:hypothetical protein
MESPSERQRGKSKVIKLLNHTKIHGEKRQFLFSVVLWSAATKRQNPLHLGFSGLIVSMSLSICKLIISERTHTFTDIVQIVFMPTGRNWTRS